MSQFRRKRRAEMSKELHLPPGLSSATRATNECVPIVDDHDSSDEAEKLADDEDAQREGDKKVASLESKLDKK